MPSTMETTLDTEFEVREKGFEWGFTSGPVVVKNSMTLDPAGQWIETTDVIINNGPARRTVELRVRRLIVRQPV